MLSNSYTKALTSKVTHRVMHGEMVKLRPYDSIDYFSYSCDQISNKKLLKEEMT